MKSRCLHALSFLALISWGNAEAAVPRCANPIPDLTWTGSGTKSYQFQALTFTDADLDVLRYTASQADGLVLPSWLSFNPSTRTFFGNPPAGVTKLQLRVIANDGIGNRASCGFALNVANANDMPTVREAITDKSWRRGSALSFQFSSTTFRDPDSDRLTYTARQSNGSALPSWLRFSSSTRTFSGTPPAYASTLTIRLTATDGRGGTVSDSFVIAFSNRAPVAANDTLSVTSGQAVSDTLTATDADRNLLTYRIVGSPTKGQVNLTNASTGAFTYTPNSGVTGIDTFTFRANDGRVDSNLATMTVTILRDNHDPMATSGILTVFQNTATTGMLSASDSDQDSLTYAIVSNGTKGTVSLINATTGEYRYTPNSGATGTDTFTFKANDGTDDSNVATVTVTIQQGPAQEITNSLGMTFKLIPAGTFMMGASDSDAISADTRQNNATPQHQVTITRAFYMQTTEITQGQWRAVMGNNPSGFSRGDNHPVETVYWNDLQSFITTLNTRNDGIYRLPTEAEWEYAARAGTTTAWSFGDSESSLGSYAWYYGNSSGSSYGTHPVAQKLPNPWGLYDMHGNVWEWVQDWYGYFTSSAETDPQGPSFGRLRVVRGGSWISNHPTYLRSAIRQGNYPDAYSFYVGARLVLIPRTD
ncbi:MAG: SUMF1/EgtB/PvdO family nonheme iron enzyme [Magnetococcales bacterium]|nr:SUMF1/EgtB/PvdO family nonheme iron enzyme [Magnetococcales bacterium]